MIKMKKGCIHIATKTFFIKNKVVRHTLLFNITILMAVNYVTCCVKYIMNSQVCNLQKKTNSAKKVAFPDLPILNFLHISGSYIPGGIGKFPDVS